MPVDLYIGPKKRGAPWWQGCLLTLVIVVIGAYLAVLILASRGIYVSENIPLPETFQPTATPSPTPTEAPANRMQRAETLFNDGQFDAAIAEYQAVIVAEPLNDVAYARMVKPLILTRKIDKAVEAARRALQINDQRAENLTALAEALDWQGNYIEALDFALRATELAPHSSTAWAIVAEVYADLNRPERALPAAQKAVQLDDRNYDAHRNLGYAQEARGRYRDAIPAYQRAIQLRPKFGYLYISLARNYRALNNFKDAIATLQQALQVDPKNPQVYDELGWTYQLAGDSARAIAQLRKAIEVDPNYEVAYGHLGHVYFVQQDWQGAVNQLEKAIQLGGTRLEYYYKLGIAYVNLKDCGKGREWLEKAITINSGDTAVQGAVAWYVQHCEAPPTPTRRR